MALLFEMRKLAQGLLEDYNTRQAAVADLRSQVKQELKGYRAAHQAMTADQQRRLEEHMQALRTEVIAAGRATMTYLKDIDAAHQAMTAEQQQALDAHMHNLHNQVTQASQATTVFLQETNQEHQTMTAKQQQWLTEQMGDLRQQVADLRHTAAAFVSELDASNQSMAADLDQRLSMQRAQLASETVAFRSDVSSAHQEMAFEQKQSLSENQDALRQTVEELRRDAADFVKGLDQAHHSMAADQQRQIAGQRSHLKVVVSAARSQSQAEQQARRIDQAEARLTWTSIQALKQQGRTHIDPAKQAMAGEIFAQPVAAHERSAQPSEPTLLGIRGIGPAMMHNLNDNGIRTYAQLAASDPEQLRQVLGKAGRLAKIESWISQAKKFTE